MLAGGFTTLAVVAAGNVAAMIVLHARGYGTLPLAMGVAVYAAAAASCAARVRAGQARSLRGAVTAWVVSGLGVWLTLALTYRPGPMFWAVSAAALASWGAAAIWARRRLSGHGGGGDRRHLAAPRVASNAVGDGAPHVGGAGISQRAGARPAVGV